MQPQQATRGGNRFSRDLTDTDLSSHLRSVTASGGIHVDFFHRKVRIKSRSAAVNGTFETRLCVAKQPKGDRATRAVRFIDPETAQRLYPREYAMFQEYHEVPTTGTPLDELPGISMSQMGILTLNGLRSVEDLVELSEDQVGQIGLDAIKAYKVAKSWVERREEARDKIDVADVEARFQMQMETMARQMEAMTERNKALEAQISGMQMAQAGGNAVSTAADPVALDVDEGFEYDLAKMPDPMSEGPDTTDGSDDIGDTDPDPLGE